MLYDFFFDDGSPYWYLSYPRGHAILPYIDFSTILSTDYSNPIKFFGSRTCISVLSNLVTRVISAIRSLRSSPSIYAVDCPLVNSPENKAFVIWVDTPTVSRLRSTVQGSLVGVSPNANLTEKRVKNQTEIRSISVFLLTCRQAFINIREKALVVHEHTARE